MGNVRMVLVAAGAAGATAAGIAAASGGPPPPEEPAPRPETVVAHGSAQHRVAEPAKRTNRSIEREVRKARLRAIPRAVAVARVEAAKLASAVGITPGEPIGIARDVAPAGFYEEDSGRFGPGRWCGHVGSSRRTCQKPSRVSVRVTLTLRATDSG